MSMAHYEINHSDTPIRLFKSDFLEFFTHISPVVVLIIWTPVAIYFLARAIHDRVSGSPLGQIPIGLGVGLFVWTFTEYAMHRFVFHYRPRTPWQERIVFLFHGVHHAQPQLKTRLVMPPVVSVPLAFVIYGIFSLICTMLGGPQWVAPLFAGAVAGYLIYDMTHYATHHLPMRWGYLKFVKQYHMKHHYKTPNARFGVSSPLWDYVFGTMPAE